MTESTSLVKQPSPSRLTCPHCGSTDEFMFRENHILTVSREVGEIVDGVLQVEADYELSPMGDAGTGTPVWLECGECDKEFALPAELRIKFVHKRWE